METLPSTNSTECSRSNCKCSDLYYTGNCPGIQKRLDCCDRYLKLFPVSREVNYTELCACLLRERYYPDLLKMNSTELQSNLLHVNVQTAQLKRHKLKIRSCCLSRKTANPLGRNSNERFTTKILMKVIYRGKHCSKSSCGCPMLRAPYWWKHQRWNRMTPTILHNLRFWKNSLFLHKESDMSPVLTH